MLHALWREIKRNQDGEEQAGVGGLCCHLGQCDTWAHAATEGNVWAQEPTKAGICVDVCDPILLKAIWMPMIWATTWPMSGSLVLLKQGSMLISVIRFTTRGHY